MAAGWRGRAPLTREPRGPALSRTHSSSHQPLPGWIDRETPSGIRRRWGRASTKQGKKQRAVLLGTGAQVRGSEGANGVNVDYAHPAQEWVIPFFSSSLTN